MQQPITDYAVYTHAEYEARDDLIYPELLNGNQWAAFMREDEIANRLWVPFHQHYPEFQLYIAENNTFIARLKSVPVLFEGDFADLPDAGWDWALQNTVAIAESGEKPNMLSAIEISILPDQRGKGLSRIALELMRYNAQQHGFDTLIAPVRPNQKHSFPLIPMDDYITWRREDGLLYDAWLRVHERMGADVVKVAPQSMRIVGTIDDWRSWTALTFPGSGKYVVPEALTPVDIDLEGDGGVYIEPNVWVVHPLSMA